MKSEERRYGRLELYCDLAWLVVLIVALLWIASGTRCQVRINMLDSDTKQEARP